MRHKIMMCSMALLVIVYIMITGCSSGDALPESQRLVGESRINMRSGNIDLRNQLYDNALNQYKKVLNDFPYSIEALKKIGDIYFFFAEQNPTQAREHYSTAYGYYERALSAHKDIKDMGTFNEIEEMIDDVELKKMGAWSRIFIIGQNLYNEEKIDESLETFYHLAELAPDSTKTYMMIASIYQSEGDADKSAEYFRKIAQTDKKDTAARTNLALYYFNKQNYDEALKWYDEAIVIEPENANIYYMKGIVYSSMQNLEQSLSNFEKAYETDNDYTDALINAANLAYNLEKFDKSIQYGKKALLAEPENDDVYLTLLASFHRTQNYQELLEYALTWYEMDKTNVTAVDFVLIAAVRLNNNQLVEQFSQIREQLN